MGIAKFFSGMPPSAKARSEVQVKATPENIKIILLAGLGSFTFGYANNAIAGSLVQASFAAQFFLGEDAPSVIAGMLGTFLGGCLIGSILQAPISNRFGRRKATAFAAVVTVVSAALLAGSVNLPMFLVGRVLGGIGAGVLLTVCPVYMSEISPPDVRGMLVANHAISVVYGYILSSLVALGLYYLDAPYQWRLQFVFLGCFGLLLLLSLAWVPESPRWLCQVGRVDEAWAVCKRLHQSRDCEDSSQLNTEMAQIKAQIEAEKLNPAGYVYILTSRHLTRRVVCSVLTWVMGQSTGILVIANLTPVLFGQLGFSVTLQLGFSVVWTVCALLGCYLNAYLMDRVGRVKLLVCGGYLCSITLIFEAVLQKYYLNSSNTAGINAAVAVYFVWILVYGSTVDCAAYVYVSEIWPTHLRSYGNTIGTVTFFGTAIAYTSPASLAFKNIGWKYYFVMISVCLVTATIMLFVCPETARLTLEEIDVQFNQNSSITTDADVGPQRPEKTDEQEERVERVSE